MAKGSKKKYSDAALVGIPPAPDSYNERISVPFPLEELTDLKLGQEIVITIKGCVNRLEGDKYYSCVSVEIEEQSWRKTSNSQAEGIKKLTDESDGDY